jgi:type VI protein secretion system component VasF
MHTDKDDIPLGREGIGPQKWLDFLEGRLPEDERREMEEAIDHSDLLKDALEGLQPLQGKEDLQEITRQLNQHLHKQLAARKRPRRDRTPMPFFWVIVALVVVLAIIFLGYYFYTRS